MVAWSHVEDMWLFLTLDQGASTDVVAAQAQYLFTTELMGMFRYEYLNVNHFDAIHRYIPAVTYAPMQNAKFTLEYQHADADNGDDANLYLLGVRVAF